MLTKEITAGMLQEAELYKDLEAEYEFLTSREQFVMSCDCNEVLFDIEIEGEDDEIYS